MSKLFIYNALIGAFALAATLCLFNGEVGSFLALSFVTAIFSYLYYDETEFLREQL